MRYHCELCDENFISLAQFKKHNARWHKKTKFVESVVFEIDNVSFFKPY